MYAQPADPGAPLESLVDAERSFARVSIDSGMQKAFLDNLSTDGIIFRPRAVRGRQWMIEHPAPDVVLSWQPAFADIAAPGDMGHLTGPWQLPRKGRGYHHDLWRVYHRLEAAEGWGVEGRDRHRDLPPEAFRSGRRRCSFRT